MQNPTKTHFMTNKTSHNGSQTSKPEATASTGLPSTHQNKNSEHCRNTARRLKSRKTNSQVTSTSSHTSLKIPENQNNLQDTWHKEITPHTVTTMTSWKDHTNF